MTVRTQTRPADRFPAGLTLHVPAFIPDPIKIRFSETGDRDRTILFVKTPESLGNRRRPT